MPPKVKITKEDIVDSAVEIVKRDGASAINARNIAAMLKCSTQPVFSNFANMDELKLAVVDKVDKLCQDYMSREISCGKYPAYKATGMAYIRFAKEEKELFKLLYMRDRSFENVPEGAGVTPEIQSIIESTTGFDSDRAKLFHLEIWAFVHGIATMFATGFLDLDWDLISSMVTDTYQGLLKQFREEN